MRDTRLPAIVVELAWYYVSAYVLLLAVGLCFHWEFGPAIGFASEMVGAAGSCVAGVIVLLASFRGAA